ncbi:MAG TPA: hypothetical protein VFG54_04530 [Prolixibacteraceae bacterium]|nr:hypothetical protein [Prolixibacteraceae bacterium]
MKAKIGLLVLALCTTFFTVEAQRRVVTTTRAMSYDISDNLDLDAVASIFGDSENLEDFEHRLNDPDNRISNLDLNQDGYIDYLRVVENSSDRNSLIVVQAVLDQDIYQDVATIEVERIQSGRLRVQVVGDSYIYGPNYIIEPVYVHTPVIFSFFWSSHYRPYYSPYYWGYYPRWYSYYSPYPTHRYHRHVHHHINVHHTYHRTSERNINFSKDRYERVRRNDYASRNPDRAFTKRNSGVSNKYELERRRPETSSRGQRNVNPKRQDTQDYQYNRESNTGRTRKSGEINPNRRPSTSVQSNSGRTRTRENVNVPARESKSGRTEQSGTINQTRRPAPEVQSGQGQPKSKEIRIEDNNRNRSGSSGSQNEVKSGNRNESRSEGSVNRSKPVPTASPNRSGSQVDSRRSSPREKSGTITNRSRGGGEVKQAPQNTRKSEPAKSEEREGSGNGRRR